MTALFLCRPESRPDRLKIAAFSLSKTDAVTSAAKRSARDGDFDKAYRLTFLEGNPGDGWTKHQNLVTVSPAPIPVAGILLLITLGGLGLAGRRRKAA
jgi:hypothetical protein